MFMKLILVALVAVVTAAPHAGYEPPHEYDSIHIPILKDDREGPDPYGNYHFYFETGDGISRQEHGAPLGEKGAVASQGRVSFTFPDGTPFELIFDADDKGYRPQSDHLPVPPPLPQHAIDQIRYAQQQDVAAATSYSPPSNHYN